MLRYLKVKDYALIDEVELSFSDGLNVLTGETGAGKSLIVDCLALISGARADAQFVKKGREAAAIEAAFDINREDEARRALLELGITPEEEGVLILSREITKAGKSRARIDGKLVSAGELAAAAGCLIDIFGQHDGLNMLKPSVQLASVDSFLTEEGRKLLVDSKARYESWTEASGRLKELSEKAADRQARLDYLDFQVKELAEAAVEPGEEASLAAESKVLANTGKLLELLNAAYAALYDTGNDQMPAVDLAKSALDSVSSAGRLGIGTQAVEEGLSAALIGLADAAEAVRRLTDGLDMDPERASIVEQRLAEIGRVKRKYRLEADELQQYLEKCRQDSAELRELEVRTDAARLDCELKRAEMLGTMRHLSSLREQAARCMSSEVEARLAELMMPKARFVAMISPRGPAGAEECQEGVYAGANGLDAAEFLFSANVGEEPKPLSKVASGGELSRFMLAFKVAGRAYSRLNGAQVFDEVDQGVGGAAAISVAAKLKEASEGSQVLSVTHLAQIAAAADMHIRITKGDDGISSFVRAEAMEGDARLSELARMLSGSASPEAIGHARTLLGSWSREKYSEKTDAGKTNGAPATFTLFEGGN